MKMIEKDNQELSITKQCELLEINRTSFYYKPFETIIEEYRIKWLIDEIYTEHPEYGYRRMTAILNINHGIVINRKGTWRILKEQ